MTAKSANGTLQKRGALVLLFSVCTFQSKKWVRWTGWREFLNGAWLTNGWCTWRTKPACRLRAQDPGQRTPFKCNLGVYLIAVVMYAVIPQRDFFFSTDHCVWTFYFYILTDNNNNNFSKDFLFTIGKIFQSDEIKHLSELFLNLLTISQFLISFINWLHSRTLY